MSTKTPSTLKDVVASTTFRQDVDDGFSKLNERVWKVTASEVSGIPTTSIGAPGSGAHVLNERWIDPHGAEFRCVTAGTPGTWIQIRPAVVTANPSGAPTGYWIIRQDLAFAESYWDGSAWIAIGGSGIPSDFANGEVFNLRAKERTVSASFDLAPTDNGIWLNVDSATDITVTFDSADSLPTGFSVTLYQQSTGKAVLTPAGTHTLENWQTATKTAGSKAVAFLKRIGATDEFVLTGAVV